LGKRIPPFQKRGPSILVPKEGKFDRDKQEGTDRRKKALDYADHKKSVPFSRKEKVQKQGERFLLKESL